MSSYQLPTLRRIGEMVKDNPSFTRDDLRRIYFAFEQLQILKKFSIPEMMKSGKEVFTRDHDQYREKMLWINDFLKSKGISEDIFRDFDSFEIASDDYDYYYELKTPEQLIEDEKKRTQKVIDDTSR